MPVAVIVLALAQIGLLLTLWFVVKIPTKCLQNAFKMPSKCSWKLHLLALAQIVKILFVTSLKEVKISIATVDVERIFHSKILQM
jgi:hypothetical protein